MKKLSLILNIVFAGVIALGAYKFIFAGSVEVADDGRTAIIVQAGERDFLLGEMRGFLEAVEGIVAAIAADDLETVASLSTSVGMAATGGETAALIGKLPLDFKTFGLATHALFDDLAAEATAGGDRMAVAASLGALLGNCTTCHAGYRIDVADAGN
jgi:cytochrome c556